MSNKQVENHNEDEIEEETSSQQTVMVTEQEMNEAFQQTNMLFRATKVPISSVETCLQKCKGSNYHYDRLSNADQVCLRNCYKKFNFAFEASMKKFVHFFFLMKT